MSMFLALLLTPPAAALALLAAFLALEVVGAFARHRPTPFDRPSPIAVVIPAHDEGAGLRATVEEAKAQLAPGDRLVVIADNCSDDTADAARAAGAEVLERTDPDRRGKGFALQFALDALRAAPPDVVYFIDADCIPEAGAIEKVAAAAHASGRPAQGLTLMTAPEGAPPHRKVAEFAWLMMNRIRMAGLFRWFDVTRLTGTGMALPWRIATDLDLASGEIVEDLALSLALTRAGTPPVFAPDAVIRGTFPASEAAAARQRARWEHGSISAARRNAPAMMARAVLRGDVRSFALALDLATPPLVLFALMIGVMTALGLIGAFAGVFAPLALSIVAAVLFVASVGAGWARWGRSVLPLSAIGDVVAYVMSKRAVYGDDARASTKAWTRTERSPGPPAGDGGA